MIRAARWLFAGALVLGACHRSSATSDSETETHPVLDAATYLEMAMAGASASAAEPLAPIEAQRPPPPPPPPDLDRPLFLPNGDVPADFEFSYAKTGCFGDCPSFALTVDPKGLVSFDSESSARTGRGATHCSKQLGAAGVKQLVHVLSANGFFGSGPNRFGPTDNVHQNARLHMSGRDHDVDVNFGAGIDDAEKKLFGALDAFFGLDQKTLKLRSGC